ncbi:MULTISPECIES: hypothetical protein [Prauserella salsuginis group]|uniref:Uncharacterized protein n=2 Tax=Prauserella salsuginis group TaxID=2893672 RepID=A0A839XQ18_9PSEU|nr:MULTISPECIES: hypothetical protein [Prauserella salsuginis group]MBB3663584.1 hypothetical protein [Prauserella sediminis]MCR3722634.1 hypothetical protein [Prauserella flava]MCR3737076.1 hypothetical protein [Prauserella salsuginis]
MTGPSTPESAAFEPAASEPAASEPAASGSAAFEGTASSDAPTSPDTPAEAADPEAADPEAAERSETPRRAPAARRRIAEVFGEVLPETTSDERDPAARSATSEDWYLQNRPPHHDR